MFREYLDDFCTNYLNDILINSKTRKKHIKHVFKILKNFQKADFFLNINKYEFFVSKIKYLNLIIIIEKVKMNLIKVTIIIN